MTTRPEWFWRYVQLRHGNIEPELALLPLLCRRDRISIDIGASEGMYLNQLVRLSRSSVAFEPRPRAAGILRAGYRDRAVVHAVALSDRDGTAEMRVPRDWVGYSTIETSNQYEGKLDGAVDRVTVPVKSLDDYALDEVAFVKIDVEGHEEAVLRGAARTIARSLPALLIEVEERHNAGSIERVTEMLARHGYRRFWVRGGRMFEGTFDPKTQQDPSALRSRRTYGEYLRNFLFLPAHRIGDIEHLRG